MTRAEAARINGLLGGKEPRHGRSARAINGMKPARVYTAWKNMNQRCYNKNRPEYHRYGGRGISVCDRWRGALGFEAFLADMGEPGDGLTLDRIDNDRGYSPDNCRWATRAEQGRHSSNVKIDQSTADIIRRAAATGEKLTWISRRLGVNIDIVGRVARGRTWAT